MKRAQAAATLATIAVLAACATAPTEPQRATAQLQPTKGNKTIGEVTFEQVGDKMHVLANVHGLKPGAHGFHIHEIGDCSSGDGMSTKGHFNPEGKMHGYPGSGHAGDLPALLANAKGQAKLDVVTTGMSIGSGPDDIVGRGLIVHADADDYKTQPTGNSGARVACGVIKLD
ncbi:MAG: superoxide dismutase family protein [Burkholderiales bacterium]